MIRQIRVPCASEAVDSPTEARVTVASGAREYRSMLKKRRDSAFRVSAFKGCAALVAVSMFGPLALLFNPQSALAACSTSGVDPVTVSCAANTSTANTTNTTSPNAATSDRIQQFNADLIGQINSGVTVDTFGLNLVTTKANGCLLYTSPSPRD